MSIVAVIQMVSSASVEQNLQSAERLLMLAADQGAQLAVLPENFALFAAGQIRLQGWQEATSAGAVRSFLSTVAKRLGLWVVAGSLPVASKPYACDLAKPDQLHKVYSRCFVFNDTGIVVAEYDKMHLFDVDVADGFGCYRESDDFVPGERVVVVETPFGRLGLSICYDLRFPELFRLMTQQGADMIALPAAFTAVTGAAHWCTLLRSRAIENQCVVLAANQGGTHGQGDSARETYGHSMIVDAWGDVQAELAQGEGVALWQLNQDRQVQVRKKMPVSAHQRIRVSL
ncbi:MAG: carbon-nitrogen hydrolase [Alteromonadaceae bacterium]|nr:MAG: carbon-nitrogen hydrolase [Alteromonadaceae bacterium]